MLTARRAAAALAALLLVLAVWTAVALLSARQSLLSSQESLEVARSSASSPADVRTALADAEDDLAAAVGALDQPGPSLVAHVPLLGRTVSGIDATGRAGLALVSAGNAVLRVLDGDGDRPLVQQGRVDTARLTRVADALERGAWSSAGPVRRLGEAPTSLVPGQVTRAVEQAREELGGAPAALAQGARGVRALVDLVGGEEAVPALVLLQNNAELRGTGGLVSVYAEARIGGGRVDVGRFADVEDVADPSEQARPVSVPDDYGALWGRFLAGTTLWKNVNMSPDVPLASSVLRDVAGLSTGTRPEVVVWLDVRAVAEVVRASGSIRLPDGAELTGDTTVRQLLSDAYQGAPDTREGQALRRERLRGAADAVLQRLLSGRTSPRALGEALARSASGRHLAVWSAEPQQQEALLGAAVGGEVQAGTGDLVAPVTQNLGGGRREGNKLDYYHRRQVTVDVVVGPDTARVQQRLEVRNNAPSTGLPDYVAGFDRPGTSTLHVSLALPLAATDVRWSRGGAPLVAQRLRQRDHAVLTDVVALPPGNGADWTVTYTLPLRDGRYDLTLVPQALAVDAGLSLQVRAGDGLELVSDNRLQVSGPFADTRTVRARTQEPGRLTRAAAALRRFWTEPVTL